MGIDTMITHEESFSRLMGTQMQWPLAARLRHEMQLQNTTNPRRNGV